ncbi:hypothetical protein [Caminibacter pacificus]|uniref:HD domain-containing protein n=1 Tax=Caminibacter pacificus TaxID=1424653 RepID=A0AAJ4RE81_9BACT|nr:hypothetical protein [Caminibacter pacificus]ROR40946.1 hypothetical protein EDC58_0428 [Caminibacter pacificus]
MNSQLLLFKELINLSIYFHTEFAKNENNLVRKHDKFTPFYLHPVTCAGMVMEDDNNINIKDRFLIASTLLFHDVLEDTTISDNKLKLHISEIFQKYYNYQLEEILGNEEEVINKILDLVKQATTIGGSEKEYKYLKANEEKITQELWYLKFIDKYFNILGSKQRLTQNAKWEFYKEFLNYLASQTSKTRFKDSIWLKTVKCID